MSGRINCRGCTRWRPVSDFRPTASKRGPGEYPSRTCDYCIRKAKRERAKRKYMARPRPTPQPKPPALKVRKPKKERAPQTRKKAEGRGVSVDILLKYGRR